MPAGQRAGPWGGEVLPDSRAAPWGGEVSQYTPPMANPPLDLTAQQLLDCYVDARQVTATLRQAVEQEQTDDLDALLDERAALLGRSAQLLGAVAGRVDELEPAFRQRLTAELASLIEEDRGLQASLSSRTQELPARLAELRASRAILGGYQANALSGAIGPAAAGDGFPPPGHVDRRG
jgi:hypothetical protein